MSVFDSGSGSYEIILLPCGKAGSLFGNPAILIWFASWL
jgi:hypothetical protein